MKTIQILQNGKIIGSIKLKGDVLESMYQITYSIGSPFLLYPTINTLEREIIQFDLENKEHYEHKKN